MEATSSVFVRSFRQRMGVQPQCAGREGRINPDASPPRGFIAATMDLAMVSTAQWNGVLVANLSSERTALGKSEVVGIRESATTNQTGVLGNRFDVIAVTNPARLWQG